MAESFANAAGRVVVDRLIDTIHENRAYLSEIDGKIGDGDHGINMDKGFQLTQTRLDDTMTMSDAMKTLGRTLMLEIGGSMGPLYGKFYRAMARVSSKYQDIDSTVLSEMISAALEAVREIGEAKPGDKTLIDTLSPATLALQRAVNEKAPPLRGVERDGKRRGVGVAVHRGYGCQGRTRKSFGRAVTGRPRRGSNQLLPDA